MIRSFRGRVWGLRFRYKRSLLHSLNALFDASWTPESEAIDAAGA